MSRGKLTEAVMLYMTEEMKIDIEIYSQRLFCSKSQFIRDAVDSYISGMTTPGTDGTI